MCVCVCVVRTVGRHVWRIVELHNMHFSSRHRTKFTTLHTSIYCRDNCAESCATMPRWRECQWICVLFRVPVQPKWRLSLSYDYRPARRLNAILLFPTLLFSRIPSTNFNNKQTKRQSISISIFTSISTSIHVLTRPLTTIRVKNNVFNIDNMRNVKTIIINFINNNQMVKLALPKCCCQLVFQNIKLDHFFLQNKRVITIMSPNFLPLLHFLDG